MLISFFVSATVEEDKIEEYLWSGNISLELAFQLLAKVLVLETEKKCKETKE